MPATLPPLWGVLASTSRMALSNTYTSRVMRENDRGRPHGDVVHGG